MINGLAIKSSSQHAGLFGYTSGTTIKNIVLGSSCSVVSSYASSSSSYGAHVGSVTGYSYGSCIIENNVNMGSATFIGNAVVNKYSYIGGIVGYASASSNKEFIVRNCANYGPVTHSGKSSYAYIGGIVGCFYEGYPKYIQNCLNYGDITHSGTVSSLYIGGILGYANGGTNNLENCVSAGTITSSKANNYNYIGSIVGYIYSGTTISHCYWTSNDGYNKAYGSGSGSPVITDSMSFDPITFELSNAVSVNDYTGTSLVDALNAFADR